MTSSVAVLFLVQLVMAVVLLVYIIRRARTELNKTVVELDTGRTVSDSEVDLLEKGEADVRTNSSRDMREFYENGTKS